MSGEAQESPLSAPVVAAVNDLIYEFIIENAELAQSLAVSAREAAWRGNRGTLGVHLRQLRLTVIALLRSYNEIGDAQDEDRRAA